VKHIRVNNYV